MLGLFILLFIATGVFYIYKDQIAQEILSNANKYQKGEIIFSDISLNPFVQFPNVSIQLNEVSYYENSNESINPNFKIGIDTLEKNKDSLNTNFKVGVDALAGVRKPIAKFQYLYGAIDILELIKGDIDISKVMLKNGKINIVKYPDSTFNYSNAIASTKIEPEVDSSHVDHKGKDLSLLLDEISLNNVQISYLDSVEYDHKIILIDALNASLEYLPDLISTDIDVQLQLVEFGITKKLIIRDKTISLTSSLNYNRTDDVLKILPGILGFEEAIFNFSGMIDFRDKGYIDMEIDGSDQDFGLSKLLLTETGVDQIQQGDLYFNGTIKGQLSNGIPNFNFSFGLKDVDLHIPNVNSDISNINLDGLFTSGIKSNLSQAKLSAKNIRAKLPGGQLEGNCEIRNFNNPELKLDWDMQANIEGFEDIFKLDFIDSLGGYISLKDHLVARYDPELEWVLDSTSYTFLELKDLSFILPEVLNMENFSGNFSGGNDTLKLDSVKILTGNTDLLINGEIYNIITLLLNNDRNITSNLAIQSDVLDLSELLAYDPRVGENFPYQIVDIDLLVKAKTSSEKLSNFHSNPEIDFDIENLEATIQNFLPPVYISKGLFKLHEKKERLLLNFDDFEIEIEGGDIKADVEYYSPSILPDYVNIKTKVRGLVPGKLFYNESTDSIPEALSGILNGSLICDLTLSIDTNIFDKILVDQGDLIYETSTDTISINSLFLEAENVYYNLEVDDNPLATLSSKCFIKAQEVNMGVLKLEDLKYDLDISHGEYYITPMGINFFNQIGQGSYFLKPFNKTPSYELSYSVDQFLVEDLLSRFSEDTLITGKADFKMNIKLQENLNESFGYDINGDVYLKGDDLILYGLDTDKFIKNLKRSQNFNLVDLAAVVVTGPYALLVTKGSDYARIFLSNSGEVTHIQSIVSDWEVINGRLTAADVAFSTPINRLAAKGWMDINTDSLNLEIAVLNNLGCSAMSQELLGTLKKPELGELQVVESLIAPVTNLVKNVRGIQCNPFYEGKVKHPEKQEKNN